MSFDPVYGLFDDHSGISLSNSHTCNSDPLVSLEYDSFPGLYFKG